ncbi:hypothetical protein EZS27_028976 [termite gut metagenome]|uniref:Resolvase/invertase-type recombinase catalytic domain-containing protein n=1 Tax=termite gut metagenome TaxID=433724 RepID=A0A5J4QHI2_9ZZZZ
MKAALSLRVSTEVQDLESQIKDLRPVAESMGYEVPEEYIFGEHITGKDDIRKGERQSITKLKKACKTGDISAIFIHEVSRLSRSSIDGRSFVRDFNEMKIPIYFKDRGLWTLNRDTLEEDSTTKMIVGLFFDFAEQELSPDQSYHHDHGECLSQTHHVRSESSLDTYHYGNYHYYCLKRHASHNLSEHQAHLQASAHINENEADEERYQPHRQS